jgi:hypothetical protein
MICKYAEQVLELQVLQIEPALLTTLSYIGTVISD